MLPSTKVERMSNKKKTTTCQPLKMKCYAPSKGRVVFTGLSWCVLGRGWSWLHWTTLSASDLSCIILLSTPQCCYMYPSCLPLPLNLYLSSVEYLSILWSVTCSSWIVWLLAEQDHRLVEVIFSGNGSRTLSLSGQMRRQAHYSFILALQASCIIFHNHSVECITFLPPFFSPLVNSGFFLPLLFWDDCMIHVLRIS